MKPKFTDTKRYPRGYVRSEATDIGATFRRIKAEQRANATEAEQKVEHLKPRIKARA